MKTVLFLMAWCFILVCDVVCAQPSTSKTNSYGLLDELKPYLRLNHFSFDLAKFRTNKELMLPEIPADAWDARVAANFNFTALRYIFWRNRVHGESAGYKFYSVGWQYNLGIKITKQIEFFWDHHSRHTMDVEQPYYVDRMDGMVKQQLYPVEDSFVLRLIFINR